MRMGKQEKFSPSERETLSANTKWLEIVNLLFNLSTTYLYGAYGVGKLPKYHYEHASTVLEAVFSHLALATGRKLTLLTSSQDESKSNLR